MNGLMFFACFLFKLKRLRFRRGDWKRISGLCGIAKNSLFGIVCFLTTVIHFLVVFAKGILVRAISFSDFITQTKFCGWIAICCISLFYPLVHGRPARGRHYLGKIYRLPMNIFIINNKLMIIIWLTNLPIYLSR